MNTSFSQFSWSWFAMLAFSSLVKPWECSTRYVCFCLILGEGGKHCAYLNGKWENMAPWKRWRDLPVSIWLSFLFTLLRATRCYIRDQLVRHWHLPKGIYKVYLCMSVLNIVKILVKTIQLSSSGLEFGPVYMSGHWTKWNIDPAFTLCRR